MRLSLHRFSTHTGLFSDRQIVDAFRAANCDAQDVALLAGEARSRIDEPVNLK